MASTQQEPNQTMMTKPRKTGRRSSGRWARLAIAVSAGGALFQQATCETRVRDAFVNSAQTVFLNTLFDAEAFLTAVDERFPTDDTTAATDGGMDTADQP
ncbi:MAG: hypothetical protein ACPGXK_04125 [Phycisphaerae bacterium]